MLSTMVKFTLLTPCQNKQRQFDYLPIRHSVQFPLSDQALWNEYIFRIPGKHVALLNGKLPCPDHGLAT